MAKKLVHIVISPSGWDKTIIKYRRHRLAEYLTQQKDTADVIWIYPVSATPRISGSYGKAREEIRNHFCGETNESGIKECALPDFIPGRYMQFKSTFGNLNFIKLKKIIHSYDEKKILWFTYPAYPYLTRMINWDMIIYDCSDLWTEPSGGTRSNTFSAKKAKELIGSAETTIIKNSSVVFASSDYLAERIRIKKVSKSQVIKVENGVDHLFFRSNIQTDCGIMDSIPHPRFGYVGALRSKIDLELLDELADYNPDWSIVLVGPDCLNNEDLFHRMLQKNNVFWTGEVSYQVIPSYIKNLDIGLLPYREIAYNRAVFPIKFYEYLSQGVPIVGCGLPSTKKHTSHGIYLHVKRKNFIRACSKVYSWLDSDHEMYASKRIKLAKEAGWDKKLSQMLEYVRNRL